MDKRLEECAGVSVDVNLVPEQGAGADGRTGAGAAGPGACRAAGPAAAAAPQPPEKQPPRRARPGPGSTCGAAGAVALVAQGTAGAAPSTRGVRLRGTVALLRSFQECSLARWG